MNDNHRRTGNAVIGGDLTVSGNTTTLNTATLDVEDKNITFDLSFFVVCSFQIYPIV